MYYNKKEVNSIKPILITLSVFILMFQNSIAVIFPAINFYDELFPIILFLLFVLKKDFKLKKGDINFYMPFVIVFFIGCIGNMRTNINNIPFLILVDELGMIKIFLTMYSTKYLLNQAECNICIKYLSRLLQLYVFFAATGYIFGMLFHWDWMFKQPRFGLMTYGFVHGYAGDGWLGYYLEACYCVLTMYGTKLPLRRTTKVVCLMLTVMTIKGPALLFVAFVILYHFISAEKIKVYHIIITVILGTVVGWWYIQRYLLTPGQARAILNVTGFKIACDYFPTGMGFASFGSDLSRDFYSNAYAMYGLNKIYGLGGYGSSAYITDNYWAMVLGQFGFISAIIFAYVYYKLFKEINLKINVSKECRMSFMAMFFSFMAGSIGSAYLTSHLGVLCFMILGIYLSPKWNQITCKNKLDKNILK